MKKKHNLAKEAWKWLYENPQSQQVRDHRGEEQNYLRFALSIYGPRPDVNEGYWLCPKHTFGGILKQHVEKATKHFTISNTKYSSCCRTGRTCAVMKIINNLETCFLGYPQLLLILFLVNLVQAQQISTPLPHPCMKSDITNWFQTYLEIKTI